MPRGAATELKGPPEAPEDRRGTVRKPPDDDLQRLRSLIAGVRNSSTSSSIPWWSYEGRSRNPLTGSSHADEPVRTVLCRPSRR